MDRKLIIIPSRSYWFGALLAAISLPMIPACVFPSRAKADVELLPHDTTGVPVVPFRYMNSRGGSATVLDSRRLLTAKHVVPQFMLEAFHSGGVVSLADNTVIPFSGLVLDFNQEMLQAEGPSDGGPEGGCPLVVSKAGSSDSDEDDWALLETDVQGCFGAAEAFPIRADGPILDGTRMYLIGFPEPQNGQALAQPIRVTIGGSVENPPRTDPAEDHRLLRVRLDHRGNYGGISGGAAVARNEATGQLELVGIILGSHSTSRGSKARHALILRVPPQILPDGP